MKVSDTINNLKIFLPYLFLTFATACGGGGGSSTEQTAIELPEEVAGEIQNPNPDGDNSTLTKDNFIANTSAFYFAAQNLQGVIGLQDVFELALFQIMPSDELSTTLDCSTSGTKTRNINRLPVDDMKVHVEDSVDFLYSSCNEGFSYQTGDRSLYVLNLNGEYESDNYNITTRRHENINQTGSDDPDEDGSYNRLTNSTRISKQDGVITLFGVDVARLDASVAPDTEPHDFDEEIQSVPLPAEINVTYMETPEFRYDPFAFEIVRDDTAAAGEQLKYRWDYTIKDKKVPEHSYTTKTIKQIIIAERVRLDEEGNEESYYLPTQGEFIFVMDGSGDKVRIVFNNIEGLSVSPGEVPQVEATFDEGGDGTIDASETLTYGEFVGAFFTLLF